MKLNLGCGNNKRDGWINVDGSALCRPDQIVDLEALPWPWPDNSVSEVYLSHVLEHLGAAPAQFIGIMKELWRVCRDGARIDILVPDYRHDDFYGDPTHVRIINPEVLQLFDQEFNRICVEKHFANTPLGLMHNIDFKIEKVEFDLEEPWSGKLKRGEISSDELNEAAKMYRNVIKAIQCIMIARKPVKAG